MEYSLSPKPHLYEQYIFYLNDRGTDICDMYIKEDGSVIPVDSEEGKSLEHSPEFPLVNDYVNKSENLIKLMTRTVNLSDKEAAIVRDLRVQACNQVYAKFVQNDVFEKQLAESRNERVKKEIAVKLDRWKKHKAENEKLKAFMAYFTPTKEEKSQVESQVATWIKDLNINQKLAAAKRTGTLEEAFEEGLNDIQKKINESLENQNRMSID